MINWVSLLWNWPAMLARVCGREKLLTWPEYTRGKEKTSPSHSLWRKLWNELMISLQASTILYSFYSFFSYNIFWTHFFLSPNSYQFLFISLIFLPLKKKKSLQSAVKTNKNKIGQQYTNKIKQKKPTSTI